MALVHCGAEVWEEQLRNNLCQCITIIGGKPIVNGNNVSVDYKGKPDKMVALFDHFPVHNITVIGK